MMDRDRLLERILVAKARLREKLAQDLCASSLLDSADIDVSGYPHPQDGESWWRNISAEEDDPKPV